jgi:hypothetical protein
MHLTPPFVRRFSAAAFCALTLLLGAATAHPALQDEDSAAAERTKEDDDARDEGEKKKSTKDPITVRGCLHGTTLADVMAEEDVEGLTRSIALKGSREIRRKLKEVDRHEVEVTGVLTPAPRSPLSGRWGGTTVSIGAADPRRPIGQQTPPPVASIEVTSVRSVSGSCH